MRGERTEAKVLAKLLDCGFIVAVPFGSQRYDLIVDDGKKLIKVQVKTGCLRFGRVQFRTCSAPGSTQRARTYHGEVDAFVVYAPELEKFYWVPIAKLPNRREVHLRIAPAKNGQTRYIKKAKDFEF